MKDQIATAMTVVEAALRYLAIAHARKGRRQVFHQTAATAKAMSLTLADLVDVLIFARVLIHNRLVAVRREAAKRELGFVISKADLDAMMLVANSLDDLPLVAQRVDSVVAARQVDMAPAFVPACLQFRKDDVALFANRLIDMLNQTACEDAAARREGAVVRGTSRASARRRAKQLAVLCDTGSGVRVQAGVSRRQRAKVGEQLTLM